MVFNTKIIDFIYDIANDGQAWRTMFTETPFHEGNIHIRKANVTYSHTKDELEEYIKCSQDIIYFAEKYCKLQNGTGIGLIKLRDYQIEYLKALRENRHVICLKSRQIGITNCNAIYILHYCLFNVDKNVLITSNRRDTSVEVVDKIQSFYYNLPFFMKAGVKSWNQSSIGFDNGCKIRTASRSKQIGIGFTIDALFIEEAAFIPPNIIEPFYTAMYPVISAHKNAKIVIGSTPNGFNLFHKLWQDANRAENDPNRNSYTPIYLPYDVVPNRGKEWVEKTIKDLGSIEAFEQEYELKFTNKDDRLRRIEDKIDELSYNMVEIVNDNGDISKFKMPSNADLLNRIEKIEKKLEELTSMVVKPAGDYHLAKKVLDNPGQVTWENVQAYKRRLEDLKWAQNKYGDEFDNFKFGVYNSTNIAGFTSSTPLS